ncbi:MAG: CPBP family intramembrane metalloprotease [Caldithrix sp.]|nr:CPBP family intramembrane metalloprotease [Caldithrix sp.]
MNRTLLFLLLTFSINFGMVGIYYAAGGRYDQLSGTILAVLYMFVPLVSVLVIEKVIHQEKISKTLAISFKINRWFFIAWIIPAVMGFITLGISLLWPDVHYSPQMSGMIKRFEDTLSPEKIQQMKQVAETLPVHPIWLSLVQGLIAGVTINAVAAFGEELGWRGFLIKQFRNMHFYQAALIIGFIWGIWHAPLILMGHNYPQHTQLGVLMMTMWCILLTFLFNYVRIKARSVIAASIMHGTLNGTAGIAIIVIAGGSDLITGITGLAGMLTLLLILVGIFIYDRGISRENIMTNRLNHFL